MRCKVFTWTVLDASTSTRRRADDTGGRCLNDLVVKGRIDTMNLLRLALRYSVGLEAMTGDLSQFYYSCELINVHCTVESTKIPLESARRCRHCSPCYSQCTEHRNKYSSVAYVIW